MQTAFTAEQLETPRIAEANTILRKCVHCGFCTATCPTYVLLGDELDSPRGRIYLIKNMLESGEPATPETVKHLDRCLSCLSCMTTCPSGVHYMHLVDHARAHIEKTYTRPPMERALRWTLARILPYPMRFRVALLFAKIGRPFAAPDWMSPKSSSVALRSRRNTPTKSAPTATHPMPPAPWMWPATCSPPRHHRSNRTSRQRRTLARWRRG